MERSRSISRLCIDADDYPIGDCVAHSAQAHSMNGKSGEAMFECKNGFVYSNLE